MAYLVNMAAFDRGAQMVSDLQSEERQAMLDKKQEERDARDLEKYKRELDEYKDAKDASQKLVDSVRTPQPSTMSDLFSRYAPQPTDGQSAGAPSPSSNPVANNVTTEPAGSFTGDPRAVLAGIQAIKDPAERARAAQAFQNQLNNPDRNAELLRQNGSSPVSAPVAKVQPAPVVAPDGGALPVAANAPLATMEATTQPPPFKLPKEVMARRDALVAEAEMMAKTNRQALPGVVEKIRKFDLGLGAYEISHNVINMDEGRFSELVKRADVNPNFEAKLSGVPGGATELSIGDKKIKLNRNQAADWLTGIYLMEQGDFDGGRSIISSISKELADASAKYTDSVYNARKDALDERRVVALEMNAETNARNSGTRESQVGSQPGFNMADVDKVLEPMFKTTDPVTQKETTNSAARLTVRSLATRMQAAAQGDAVGAALQAAQAYEKALTNAKGDHAKAVQLLEAAMQPATTGTAAGTPSAAQTGSNGKTPPAPPPPPPPPPAPPPPPMVTMDEIQRKTRENKAQILKRENLADKDPDIQKLRIFAEQSLKAGKPVLANQAMSAIEQIKQKRYAAQ